MKKILALGLAFMCTAFLFGTAPAKAADTELVLYSSNQPEMIDALAKQFEAKTGIKLTSVRMGTGDAMKRIKAEAANPLCDVFWSGDTAVLDNAKDQFAGYKSPEDKVLSADLIEPQFRWTATNTHLMVIMVNTDLVPEAQMPKSWADLKDPKWSGKIVMANPQKSGSAYSQVYGLNKILGWDGVTAIFNNTKVLDSSGLVYKGTAAGESAMGITMEYSAYRYIAGGAKNIKIVYPSDGVIAAPEGVAMIKNCKHPEAAKKFIDFVLSKDYENQLFTNYFRRPARPDCEGSIGTVKNLTLLQGTSAAEANAQKASLMKKWNKLVLSK